MGHVEVAYIKQIFPWTENKEVFCFTLSASGTRGFDHIFDRSASAKVEELLILENFECTDDAFNEGIIFRWFPQ